jgi:hypothetical protein
MTSSVPVHGVFIFEKYWPNTQPGVPPEGGASAKDGETMTILDSSKEAPREKAKRIDFIRKKL